MKIQEFATISIAFGSEIFFGYYGYLFFSGMSTATMILFIIFIVKRNLKQ